MDEWENPENLDLWKKVFGCKRILIQWNKLKIFNNAISEALAS